MSTTFPDMLRGSAEAIPTDCVDHLAVGRSTIQLEQKADDRLEPCSWRKQRALPLK